MPCDINALETSEAAHADVVEMREQKRIDEVPAIDGELGVVDGFLSDLEPRWARPKETTAPAPVEFHFRLAGPRHQIRQIETKEVVALDHIGIAFLSECSETLQRGPARRK